LRHQHVTQRAVGILCLEFRGHQLGEEPRTRELPVAFERSHRDVKNSSRFVFVKSAQETKLDNFRCASIELLQTRKNLVECEEICLRWLRECRALRYIDVLSAATALRRPTVASVIDEKSPDLTGSD
jgi:hypothetical protein